MLGIFFRARASEGWWLERGLLISAMWFRSLWALWIMIKLLSDYVSLIIKRTLLTTLTIKLVTSMALNYWGCLLAITGQILIWPKIIEVSIGNLGAGMWMVAEALVILRIHGLSNWRNCIHLRGRGGSLCCDWGLGWSLGVLLGTLYIVVWDHPIFLFLILMLAHLRNGLMILFHVLNREGLFLGRLIFSLDTFLEVRIVDWLVFLFLGFLLTDLALWEQTFHFFFI